MNKIINLSKKFSRSKKLIFENKGANCKVILNNEKVLNSIDLDMIRDFREKINEWEINGFPKIVLLTHNPGTKAFSAGGDIKDIY
jgi:enoyl-CoA hydratase/carnithine racemase